MADGTDVVEHHYCEDRQWRLLTVLKS